MSRVRHTLVDAVARLAEDHIRYWLTQPGGRIAQGFKWIFKSAEEIRQHIADFWCLPVSLSTVERALRLLVNEQKTLIRAALNAHRRDQVYWYRLATEEDRQPSQDEASASFPQADDSSRQPGGMQPSMETTDKINHSDLPTSIRGAARRNFRTIRADRRKRPDAPKKSAHPSRPPSTSGLSPINWTSCDSSGAAFDAFDAKRKAALERARDAWVAVGPNQFEMKASPGFMADGAQLERYIMGFVYRREDWPVFT